MKILRSPHLIAAPAIICFYCYAFFLEGRTYLAWATAGLLPVGCFFMVLYLRNRRAKFDSDMDALLLEMEASKINPAGDEEIQLYVEKTSDLITSQYASDSDREQIMLALDSYFDSRPGRVK